MRREDDSTQILSKHREIKLPLRWLNGALVVALLFQLATGSVFSQEPLLADSPDTPDTPTIIGGYDLTPATFNPVFGVIIVDKNYPQSMWGGVTKIGPNHGLTAAHVAEHLQEGDLYVNFNCLDLSNCTSPVQRKIKYAYLFETGKNWDEADPLDIAVVYWDNPITNIKNVVLDAPSMAEASDNQVIRGHGCEELDGVLSAVQKEGLVQKAYPPDDLKEERFLAAGGPAGGVVCAGDSGSPAGVNLTDAEPLQTGVIVRTNGTNSHVEKVRVYFHWITECMAGICKAVKIYAPGQTPPTPVSTLISTPTSTPVLVGTPVGSETPIPTASITLAATPTQSPPPTKTEQPFATPTWTPGPPPATATPAYNSPICPSPTATPFGFELTSTNTPAPTATMAENRVYLSVAANGAKCYFINPN